VGLCPKGFISSDLVLGVQVAERQLQVWEADERAEEEDEEARQAEQLSEALLQQEAKTMAEQGYQPKVGACKVTDHHRSVLGCALSASLHLHFFLFRLGGSLDTGSGLILVGFQIVLEMVLLWLLPLEPRLKS
jgi:hypothetical protein